MWRLGLELLDDVEQLFDDDGRKAERELVDEEDAGLEEQRGRQAEHLLLATRQRAGGLVDPLAQDRE
jgi:hypothetical protein